MTKFQEAKHKSKYGRRDWLYWTDADGNEHIAPKSSDAVKAALIAIGTSGKFKMLTRGISHRIGWRSGIVMLSNARIGFL